MFIALCVSTWTRSSDWRPASKPACARRHDRRTDMAHTGMTQGRSHSAKTKLNPASAAPKCLSWGTNQCQPAAMIPGLSCDSSTPVHRGSLYDRGRGHRQPATLPGLSCNSSTPVQCPVDSEGQNADRAEFTAQSQRADRVTTGRQSSSSTQQLTVVR